MANDKTSSSHTNYKVAIFILAIILILTLASVYNSVNKKQKQEENGQPKIELPEEYQDIRATDTLKGYFDEHGVLHIEFNNKRNQQ